MKKFYIYADLYADGGEVYEVEAADAFSAVRECRPLWSLFAEQADAEAEVDLVVSERPDFSEPEILVASYEIEIIRDVARPFKTPDQKASLLRLAKENAVDDMLAKELHDAESDEQAQPEITMEDDDV
jgi:hypothetical protein